ncbi:MAG TPA: Ni/Fe-hydrogenase, b-type cytochrome subunit [Kofleriaceae bacterium]|nr:Ni/Fe-hydrogenase, b-type cytochrome subunit [Kofleriaceae bacterium]
MIDRFAHPARVRSRPATRAAARAAEPTVRVYVWDLVVRLTHWTIALSIVGLALTGFYIGNPFLGTSGAAGDHFVMGWARIIHFYTSIAFGLAVFARIVWMFVGPPQASWRQLIPTTRQRWRDLFGTLAFYALLRDRPPPARGHNALAGAAYLVVFGLYLLLILTGVALYSASAHVDSYMRWFGFLVDLFGGAQTARYLHHVTMWIVIIFVAQHVYSSLLTSRVEKNGTIDSIFSGYKFLPPEEAEETKEERTRE